MDLSRSRFLSLCLALTSFPLNDANSTKDFTFTFPDPVGSSFPNIILSALARGSRRVCVESKAGLDGLDEPAKLKCRALRDKSRTRVVALVGHGDQLTWHDFGCPSAGVETCGSDLDALRELLLT